MISLDLATTLQRAGLVWHPEPGDRFAIPQPDLADQVFTLSEMTIEAHVFPGGTVLGFNGTTEWALDSVMLDETVWLPREDQLRTLLGGAFRSLRATREGFEVETVIPGDGPNPQVFAHEDAATAYGQALLRLLRAAMGEQPKA